MKNKYYQNFKNVIGNKVFDSEKTKNFCFFYKYRFFLSFIICLRIFFSLLLIYLGSINISNIEMK